MSQFILTKCEVEGDEDESSSEDEDEEMGDEEWKELINDGDDVPGTPSSSEEEAESTSDSDGSTSDSEGDSDEEDEEEKRIDPSDLKETQPLGISSIQKDASTGMAFA